MHCKFHANDTGEVSNSEQVQPIHRPWAAVDRALLGVCRRVGAILMQSSSLNKSLDMV